MNKRIALIAFGFILLLAAGGVYVQYRVGSQSNLPSFDELLASQDIMPGMELPKLGAMPEFQGIEAWINSEALTPEDLEGKVVLVDFWTYSCINCIRTYPYMRDWYTKYRDQGFVIVGIHTPEFNFEKDYDNVLKATQENNLTYPVALDNSYLTWRAYRNRFWPASYLFDRDGQLRYTHFGEGNYDVTEGYIQELLGTEGELTEGELPAFELVHSPETYFGWWRSERFASPEETVRDRAATYTFPSTLRLNEWALEGQWTIREKFAQTGEGASRLAFRYHAGYANFVFGIEDGKTADVKVYVDGEYTTTLTINDADLYEAYRSAPGEHHIMLEFTDPGVEVYTITFGA